MFEFCCLGSGFYDGGKVFVVIGARRRLLSPFEWRVMAFLCLKKVTGAFRLAWAL